jgi:pyruvate dehydrogenase E2 component (dihydrolipoamide acetyltransferase)
MEVLMPQLGETVAEGTIAEWFKKVGDPIKPGENLFLIETDKVSMEIQAIAGGVLAEIRVPVGETVPVGSVVAVIADSAAAAAAPAPKPATTLAPAAPRKAAIPTAARTAAPAPAPPSKPGPVKLDPYFEVRTPDRNYGPARIGGVSVTPLARRLAAHAGIDLSRLQGSGPHGRIRARDVESARTTVPAAPVAGGMSADQIKAFYHDTPFEEVRLDSMRRTIAARLVQAAQTIPHFYLTIDVDIGRLLKTREEANAAVKRTQDGSPAFQISVNDFVVKAWAAALQRVPAANAAWAEDRILRFTHADVAVAVAIDGGLITPVIRKAEKKTLSSISAEMRDLATRARERRLKPHEYQGGSSTISNLGMYGVREFSAIINPPQATILAVGAARRQPVEIDNGIAFASVMTVTLSCDHRVVDGALGAELLAAFKALIENPVTALA